MDRRIALKKIMIASGVLVSLPSWAENWRLNDVAGYPSSFSLAEQDLLAAVVDTIIPASGDTIGAMSVGVDKFVQKLLDNCYERDVQDNVKTQLRGLDASAQQAYGKLYAGCDQSQRQELLLKLSYSENTPEKDFFNLMKTETIRGFNTSKEVMTRYLGYKVAPGYYHGCVDVKI
jgi:hypothetical protein